MSHNLDLGPKKSLVAPKRCSEKQREKRVSTALRPCTVCVFGGAGVHQKQLEVARTGPALVPHVTQMNHKYEFGPKKSVIGPKRCSEKRVKRVFYSFKALYRVCFWLCGAGVGGVWG